MSINLAFVVTNIRSGYHGVHEGDGAWRSSSAVACLPGQTKHVILP